MPLKKINREQIIRKSLQVFVQKGYYNTAVSDLAKACGVEKSHIYYYFRDKCDLMRSTLEYFKQWMHKYVLYNAFNNNINTEEKLNRILIAVQKVHSKRFVGCLFGNTVLETAGLEKEFEPVLKGYFELWKSALTEVYCEKYPADKAEQLADRFVSEIQGTIMMMKLYRDPMIFKRFMNRKLEEINS